jgi:hypothetical protein
MSEEIPEPDWESLTTDPPLDETPSDVREAFATPDFRAHGRNRAKLWGKRDSESKARAPRQGRSGGVKAKATVPNRKGQFIEPVTQFYTMVGGVIMIRDPMCGRVVIQQAPHAAEAIDDLAYTDEVIRRLLWSATQTGKYGKVLAVHVPILIVVLMHHVPAVQESMAYISRAFANTVVGEEGQNGEGNAAPTTA